MTPPKEQIYTKYSFSPQTLTLKKHPRLCPQPFLVGFIAALTVSLRFTHMHTQTHTLRPPPIIATSGTRGQATESHNKRCNEALSETLDGRGQGSAGWDRGPDRGQDGSAPQPSLQPQPWLPPGWGLLGKTQPDCPTGSSRPSALQHTLPHQPTAATTGRRVRVACHPGSAQVAGKAAERAVS